VNQKENEIQEKWVQSCLLRLLPEARTKQSLSYVGIPKVGKQEFRELIKANHNSLIRKAITQKLTEAKAKLNCHGGCP